MKLKSYVILEFILIDLNEGQKEC